MGNLFTGLGFRIAWTTRILTPDLEWVIFNQLFTNVGYVGPTLALEDANRHLRALGAARTIFDL